jgi:hypothetical protein
VAAGDGDFLALPDEQNSATVLAVSIGVGGTVIPEVSMDRATWFPLEGLNIVTGALVAGSITASGAFLFDTSGWVFFQARVSVGPGPITVKANTVRGSAATSLTTILAGAITANQGTPNTLANGWPVKLTDGVLLLGTPANPLEVNDTKAALTPSAPTLVSVGVASAVAVAANAARKGLVLTNTSNKNISFGVGAAAVLNSGITLTPNGVWVMDEFTFTTSAINAIAGGAASNLAVQEFTT